MKKWFCGFGAQLVVWVAAFTLVENYLPNRDVEEYMLLGMLSGEVAVMVGRYVLGFVEAWEE